ncbi:MAG: EamA family transporter [Clostridia bacterium]|nr:EamA family transporter [Clostridia bacterium]
MLSYIWPIALVVLSNTLYQICAKSVPEGMNPLASLTVTYLVGAAVSCALYFILNRNANLLREIRLTNWAPIVLGVVIVGLEVGFIYAFRAGWQISMAQIVSSAVLAVILIFVGYLLYHEAITWNKIVGIIVCLAGLVLINYR